MEREGHEPWMSRSPLGVAIYIYDVGAGFDVQL